MFDATTIGPDTQQLMPILIVGGLASFLLLFDVFLRKLAKGLNPIVALAGIFWALYITITRFVAGGSPYAFTDNGTAFARTVSTDTLSGCAYVILLITALISVLLAWTYLANQDLDHGEYYVLILFAVSGAMLMAAAQDLIVLFIGLEVLSFALYVLAGFARTQEKSEESSIKYFLLGAFASAFFLYGIALMYGATQTTNLADITAAVAAKGYVPSPMLIASIGLILVGLGFKAALVPFHQWTPDVYEGAPTSVTAFMAGAAKVGAFAAILRVFTALIPVHTAWLPAVQILAILTMVFGNLLAIQQNNVKRMLAYSSIAHAGYLLVAVAAIAHRDPIGKELARPLAFVQGASGGMFYLFAYVFMTLGAFGVLIYLSGKNRDCQELSDLRGLARREPIAAYSMLFFMLSLGGIPPTMGFWGKWQIFLAALQGGEITLAIVMALASVLAIYYYLRIVYIMCFEESREPAPEAPSSRFGATMAVTVSAIATLVFGIFPYTLSAITAIWQAK